MVWTGWGQLGFPILLRCPCTTHLLPRVRHTCMCLLVHLLPCAGCHLPTTGQLHVLSTHGPWLHHLGYVNCSCFFMKCGRCLLPYASFISHTAGLVSGSLLCSGMQDDGCSPGPANLPVGALCPDLVLLEFLLPGSTGA